jgi:hypothetical protein
VIASAAAFAARRAPYRLILALVLHHRGAARGPAMASHVCWARSLVLPVASGRRPDFINPRKPHELAYIVTNLATLIMLRSFRRGTLLLAVSLAACCTFACAHRRIGRTSLGDITEGRNQARPRSGRALAMNLGISCPPSPR